MVRSITSLSLASLQARRWREFFKVLEPKKKKSQPRYIRPCKYTAKWRQSKDSLKTTKIGNTLLAGLI